MLDTVLTVLPKEMSKTHAARYKERPVKIALASIFRNSTGYMERYFMQVASLRFALGDAILNLFLAEGDSTDNTYAILKSFSDRQSIATTLIKRDHGGPAFGSIDDVTRWRNISFVCNGLLDSIPKGAYDYLIYIESDLIWDPDALICLLDDLVIYPQISAVSPMCFKNRHRFFYDTWGFRKDGQHFSAHPPYHPGLHDKSSRSSLVEIDSAGSCVVMRSPVFEQARFDPPELGIVGFCQDMHARGFNLYVDQYTEVLHP